MNYDCAGAAVPEKQGKKRARVLESEDRGTLRRADPIETDGARGTAAAPSAYQNTMQYVGTLSWGMAPPAVGRAFGRPKTQGTATAPAARRRGFGGRQTAGRGRGSRKASAATRDPVRADGELGTAEASRATLAGHDGRTEVRALEQDWTQIVRRCMNGDSGAWAEMVRTHQKRVYGLCYRFTGNATDAEDLTQDVFLKIYSNLGSFDAARGSLPVWITTMTRNLLVDNYRRTRNQRATGSLDEGWDQAEELGRIGAWPTGWPTPGRRRTSRRRERTEKDGAEGADESERGTARGGDFERFARP